MRIWKHERDAEPERLIGHVGELAAIAEQTAAEIQRDPSIEVDEEQLRSPSSPTLMAAIDWPTLFPRLKSLQLQQAPRAWKALQRSLPSSVVELDLIPGQTRS